MRAKHIIGDLGDFFEVVNLGVLILLLSSVVFMMPRKNMLFPQFFDYYFLKVHLNLYSKIKSIKEVKKSRNPGFSYFFSMMMEGSECGSGSVQTMTGSGSGRFKKFTDPYTKYYQINMSFEKDHKQLANREEIKYLVQKQKAMQPNY